MKKYETDYELKDRIEKITLTTKKINAELRERVRQGLELTESEIKKLKNKNAPRHKILEQEELKSHLIKILNKL